MSHFKKNMVAFSAVETSKKNWEFQTLKNKIIISSWKIGNQISRDAALHPWRTEMSATSLRKPKISHN